MAKFILAPLAVDDMDVIHEYIFADNPDAADRVHDALLKSFDLLARNPAVGRIRRVRRHQNLRSWPLTEFQNYVVYYRELVEGGGVEIVRVFHGARNIDAILNESKSK